jgi:hypothetical protein
MPKSFTKKSKAKSAADPIPPRFMRPSHEEIAALAYHVYLSEGCPEGRAIQHWLEAEAQLMATRQADARAAAVVAPKSHPAFEQPLPASRAASPGGVEAEIPRLSEK